MCQGKEQLECRPGGLQAEAKGLTLSKKEQDSIRDMRIVQEMYARGFEFMPIDIYKAHSRLFQIIDGKIMPSLGSIDGMGDKAAEAMMEAAKDRTVLIQR